MHGLTGGPYYKGSGPSGVVKAAQADNTVHNSPGRGGKSFPAQPISGPESTYSQKKGSAPGLSGPGLPNRNTSAAGSR